MISCRCADRSCAVKTAAGQQLAVQYVLLVHIGCIEFAILPGIILIFIDAVVVGVFHLCVGFAVCSAREVFSPRISAAAERVTRVTFNVPPPPSCRHVMFVLASIALICTTPTCPCISLSLSLGAWACLGVSLSLFVSLSLSFRTGAASQACSRGGRGGHEKREFCSSCVGGDRVGGDGGGELALQ